MQLLIVDVWNPKIRTGERERIFLYSEKSEGIEKIKLKKMVIVESVKIVKITVKKVNTIFIKKELKKENWILNLQKNNFII